MSINLDPSRNLSLELPMKSDYAISKSEPLESMLQSIKVDITEQPAANKLRFRYNIAYLFRKF